MFHLRSISDGPDDHPTTVQYFSRCTFYDRVLSGSNASLSAGRMHLMLAGLPHSSTAGASPSKLRLHGPEWSPVSTCYARSGITNPKEEKCRQARVPHHLPVDSLRSMQIIIRQRPNFLAQVVVHQETHLTQVMRKAQSVVLLQCHIPLDPGV